MGILPVLAQMLDQPPATEQLLLSSLALIYGQILLPTPAGLGAVEVAFASGVAGDLGGRLTTVFLMWRGFITLVPVLLGFGLAIPSYGGSTIRAVLRGRLPAAPRRDSEPLP